MLGYVSTRSGLKLHGEDILFQVSAPKLPDAKVDIIGSPFGPR